MARTDAVEVLLETMNRISMRSFVPGPTKNTVIKRLAVYGKEVEIFSGEERIKHFFVGTETPDQAATYMMLAGAELPFAMHIQGFNGYLNSRFFTEEYLWRDRTLFGVPKEDIAEVSLTYHFEPTSTFRIDCRGTKPALFDAENKPTAAYEDVNMNIFLGSFRTANYEAVVIPTDGIWAKRDSIQKTVPVLELTLLAKDGTKQTMLAYRKRPDRDQLGEDGLPLTWDPDRMYAFLSDGRMVIIQYFGLKNVLLTHSFFAQKLMTDN